MSTSSPVRMTSLQGAVSTTTGAIPSLRSLDHLHPGLGLLAAHCPSVLVLVRVRVSKERELATGQRPPSRILHYPREFVDPLFLGDADEHTCGRLLRHSDPLCCGWTSRAWKRHRFAAARAARNADQSRFVSSPATLHVILCSSKRT